MEGVEGLHFPCRSQTNLTSFKGFATCGRETSSAAIGLRPAAVKPSQVRNH